MIIRENSGINDPIYMEDGWIRSEQDAVMLKIRSTSDVEHMVLDVVFEADSGQEKGRVHKERYFLSKAQYDGSGGLLNRGGFWKFRNLAIACGEYVEKPNARGEMKQHVKEPLDTNTLIGRRVTADIVSRKNEKDGKTYLRLEREREVEIVASDSRVGVGENGVPF